MTNLALSPSHQSFQKVYFLCKMSAHFHEGFDVTKIIVVPRRHPEGSLVLYIKQN